MFIKPFATIICLLLCARTVFTKWDFAITTSREIIFYDENWAELLSKSYEFKAFSAIAYDEIYEQIYFNGERADNGSIYSLTLPMDVNNHYIEEISTSIPNEIVAGIAYDALGRNIYWTDMKNKRIYSLPVEGAKNSEAKMLFDFSNTTVVPYGISVDVCRRQLYWTDWNKKSASIHVSSLNGSDDRVVIDSDLYITYSVAVDQFSDRIFYTVDQAGHLYTVESAKLDGTDRQVLVKGISHQPISITVTVDSVYWVDSTSNAIWKVSKFNSTISNEPVMVKKIKPLIHGIISRVGLLQKLKFDDDCKDVMNKIEANMFFASEQLETRMKAKVNNEIFCLGNGLYSEISKSCSCKEGYSGSHCQTYDCHNYCVHGTCELKGGFPKCTCQLGFDGERCQTYVCHNYCYNGQCKVVKDKPTCICNTGYTGSRCETNTTETCSAPCILPEEKELNVTHCSEICKNLTPVEEVKSHEPESESDQNKISPETCRSSWNKSVIVIVVGVLVSLVLVYLIIIALRRIYKPARPRIRKTFVVKQKVSQTPLTSRPIATEECEITIENCCNMNICDTPCFDPKLLQQNISNGSKKEEKHKKEDKEILISNMENDIY